MPPLVPARFVALAGSGAFAFKRCWARGWWCGLGAGDNFDGLVVRQLREPDGDDPTANVETLRNDGARLVLQHHLDRLDQGALVLADDVDEGTVRSPPHGGGGHDAHRPACRPPLACLRTAPATGFGRRWEIPPSA